MLGEEHRSGVTGKANCNSRAEMNAWYGLLVAGLLLVGSAAGARAPNIAWPTTNPLPETGDLLNGYACTGSQWHVRKVTPHDLAGQPLRGIPASELVVLNGVGDWNTGTPTPPPAFVTHGSAAMHGRIALFKADQQAGWIAVPRGWHARCAGEGADGSDTFLFTAPDGPDQGWLEITIGNGVSAGSYGGAEGYFKDAHRRMDAAFHMRTPDVHLIPEPATLVHPDPCTARVAYHSGTLAVQGLVLWSAGTKSAYLAEIFVALPPGNASLQNYVLGAFTQTRPTWERGCSAPRS
jgi:hypothetical protein